MATFGSSNVVDVGVAISLRNNFSRQANQISQDYNRLISQIRSQGSLINDSSGTLFSAYANVAGAMADAYTYSAGVQKEIWMASKIAGATAQQETELMQLAKDVNEKTPLTAADVASAMRYLSMAGFKAEDIKKMIEPASQLATILGAPVGEKGGVADMLTNIMATYKYPMDQVTNVVDDLYTAVTNSNISLTDLMASVRYTAADAINAGLSLRQLSAAVGVLGNNGIQGSMAGTALGNMLRFLQQSITGARSKGKAWLDAFGFTDKDFYDAQGNLLNFDTILQKLAERMYNLPDKIKTVAWNDIFYTRGSRAANALLSDIFSGNSTYFKIMGLYDKNRGIVNQTVEEFNEKPFGQLEALTSSLENLKVTFGEALTQFTPLVKGITIVVDALQKLLKSSFGGKLVLFAGISVAVGLLRNGFLSVWRTIKLINLAFPKITRAVKAGSLGTNQWTGSSRMLVNAFNQLNYSLAMIDKRLQGILIKMVAMGRASQGIVFAGVNPATGAYMWRNTKTGRFVSNRAAMGPYASFMAMPGYVPMSGMGPATTSGSYARGANFTRQDVIDRRNRIMNARYGTFRAASMRGLAASMNGLRVGTGALVGLLGGPWGLALTAGIFGLTYALGKVSDQLNKESEDMRNFKYNTDYTKLHSDLYAEAMKSAIKELARDPKSAVSLDIRVNGVPQGIFGNGDSLDINGYNDPFMFSTLNN